MRVTSRTKRNMTYFALFLPSPFLSLPLLSLPLFFPPRLAKADEGEDKVERHSPLVKVALRSMSPLFRPHTCAQTGELFTAGELTCHFSMPDISPNFFRRRRNFQLRSIHIQFCTIAISFSRQSK